jgi:hypothetical protein
MNYLFITSDNYHTLHYRIYRSDTRKHLPLNTLWEQFKVYHQIVEEYSPDHDPCDIEYLVNCFQFTGYIKLMRETETCDSCGSVTNEPYQDNTANWFNIDNEYGEKTNDK